MRSRDLDSKDVDPETLSAWRVHLGESVRDPVRFRLQLSKDSLPEAFAAQAAREPGRPALHVEQAVYTHGEVDDLAGRAASRLARLGIAEGSRVLLIADVGIEELTAYLGVLRLGATAVLAHRSLTSDEFGDLFRASSAELVVGSGNALVRAGRGLSSESELIGLRGGDRSTGSTVLADLPGDYEPVLQVDPGATAVLAFTSGTTGRPKATPLSHRNLLASIRGAMQAWRWTAHDHLLHSLPVSHQHGLSGLHATLLSGSQATLLGSFDPEKTHEIVEEGATILFGVPAIHERILDALGDRAVSLSSLRISISGSGPLPVALFHRYREVVGESLLERYGTTESGLDVSNPYKGPRVPGSVGIPLPGVEVAVIDESGEVAAMGDSGEIVIRGPHVFGGYEGLPENEQPFIGDWFRTGDIGAFEKEGHLRILARTKEVIITGGMNVYPREVEDALRKGSDLDDVAVVGVPSRRWGEEVVAVVTPATIDVSALMEATTRSLAPYKKPKRVIATEQLPRNAVGKLQTAKLLEMIPPADSNVPPDEIG